MARNRYSFTQQLRLLIAVALFAVIGLAVNAEFSSHLFHADESLGSGFTAAECNTDDSRSLESDDPLDALTTGGKQAIQRRSAAIRGNSDLPAFSLVSFVNASPRAPPVIPLA